MLIKKLAGNSGCAVLFLEKNNSYFIRKVSRSNITSKRLSEECTKLLKFEHKIIKKPKVICYGKIKSNFYYDLEYINGLTLSRFLEFNSFKKVNHFLKIIFKFIIDCKKKSKTLCKESDFKKKILTIKKKNFFRKQKKSNLILEKLSSYKWNNIDHSYCHGDLTFENLIISDDSLFFIDLSKNFVSSYKLDLSKLIFDLVSHWSFKSIEQSSNIQIFYIKKTLINFIKENLSHRDFEDIKMLALLDFYRVMSYVKDISELNKLKEKLFILYDNIDNPMRW